MGSRGRDFSFLEEELVIKYQDKMPLSQLVDLFRKHGYNRSPKSIARKIEKLREKGEVGVKDQEARKNSYKFRSKRKKAKPLDELPEEGFPKSDWGEGFSKTDWGSGFDDDK